MAVLTSAKLNSPPSFPAKSCSHSSQVGKHELCTRSALPGSSSVTTAYPTSTQFQIPDGEHRDGKQPPPGAGASPEASVGANSCGVTSGEVIHRWFLTFPKENKMQQQPWEGLHSQNHHHQSVTILQNFPAFCAGNCTDYTNTCSLLSAWFKHHSVNDNFCQWHHRGPC